MAFRILFFFKLNAGCRRIFSELSRSLKTSNMAFDFTQTVTNWRKSISSFNLKAGAYNGWSAPGNPLQRILIPPSNISIPIGKHHEDLASTTAFHCQKLNIPMAVTAGFVTFALPTHCTPLSRLCNCPHRLGNSKVVLTSAFRVPSLLFTSTITTRTTHFCLVHLQIEH